MHIPDNFLSPRVWAPLDAIAFPAVVLVSRRAQQLTDANRLPLLGVMGAFVFAAQMINFPVAAGTSGHLVGGALLACLLGPWPAALVLTAIISIQALVFQDGGVLALGANVINMALLGVLAGYLPMRALANTRWKTSGVFLGGFCSVLVSGTLALSELLMSGVHLPQPALIASMGVFAVNALLEGVITVSVLRAMERIRPGSADMRTSRRRSAGLAAISAVSVLLATVAVLLASTKPDGIQHLAASFGNRFGFRFRAPLADYHLHALGTAWLSRAVAGICGIGLIYSVCSLGGLLLGRVRRSYSA